VSILKRYYGYARTIGKSNRWNEHLDPYCVGSMGIRHLAKYPLKAMLNKDIKMLVLTFHEEPLWLIKMVAKCLKELGFKVIPLHEALKNLGVLGCKSFLF